jgi:hypothetical protein
MKANSVTVIILVIILSLPADFSMEGKNISIKKEIFLPGENIEIESNFLPENAYILTPIGAQKIEFEKREEGYLAWYPLKKNVILGKYTIFVDDIKKEVYVDSYSLEAEVINSSIHGKVKYYVVMPEKISYTILPKNITGEVEVREGKFTINIPPDTNSAVLKIEKAGLNINMTLKKPEHKKRKLKVGKLYFPGETVEIKANFMPEVAFISDPFGRSEELKFEKHKKGFMARYDLSREVILGEYTIFADGVVKKFVVDFYEINASIDGNVIRGTVSYYFKEPEKIKWEIADLEGKSKIVNGSFTIRVPLPSGNYTAVLSAGNAKVELNISLKKSVQIRKLYFPGETVEIRANFMPKNAYVITPDNRSVDLRFAKKKDYYLAEMLLTKPAIGNFTLVVDEFVKSFVVDNYSISAKPVKIAILGSVNWSIVAPKYVNYTIFPVNLSSSAKVLNGSFYIPFNLTPGNYTVHLSAGNAVLELNFSVEKKLPAKIVAFDPVKRAVIIKVEGDDIEEIAPEKPSISTIAAEVKRKIKTYANKKFLEIELPASPETIKNLGFPDKILNTTLTVKRLREDKLRVELNNKLEVWYRFKVDLPPGYRVKEIVGDDGRRIVNNLSINRLTGEIEGEVRWYVENSTLYFYDDPIWGYDITLTPPAPNNSIALELAYDGPYSGGGQISAIIFPYSQGDNDTTITQNDHAGRTEDNGYGNDIDIDAGSKIALRFNLGGSTWQYGNEYYYWRWFFGWTKEYATLGNRGNLTQLNRTDIALNTVPDGTLESVIITDMKTEGGEANVTQKVIIRDNNRWFATIYYIKPGTDLTNLRFFQGMDWNFAGSYDGDNAYYNSTYDIVYGYDSNAPAGNIQYGGYGSDLGSSAHDVNYYTDLYVINRLDTPGMLGDIYRDDLNNATSYTGDAATALAWDRASLNAGETWVVPVIWGLGFNFTDMVEQINAGKARLYDVGAHSIDYPANDSRFNPNVVQIVDFNATIALYGLVDQENVNVTINITKLDGSYTYENYTYVNLSVPFNETAQVSFPINITGMPYGSYNVSFFTNLSNDQNTSNDLKWIIIHIVAFTVEPDQAKTSSAGEEVLYNVTAGNYYSAGRFDVNITRSTKAWATRLYNGSTLIAEDSDGDGAWDYIVSGYDTNGNGLVDIYLPYGDTNLTIAKLIPATAPLGEVDYTTLNFLSVSDPGISDDVTLTTSTPLPPSQPKTFYLHGDMSMNTSRSAAASSATAIASNSQASWYQSPAFASDFTISGKVQVYLWLNSSSTGAQHTVTVSLLYTDGVTSTVLGTNSSRFAPGGTPSLHLFEITLDSITTIPRNNYLVLRVENSQTGQTLYVHHSSSYDSNVTLNTTTYVKVVEVSTDKQSYLPGEVALILANVTDPIGSYDITGANITVYYPNHTLYLQAPMSLNTTDSSTPSLWKTFNYSLKLPVEGVYTVIVTGIESNGVVANLSREISAFVRVAGRVFEDLGVLGGAFNSSEDAGVANATVAIFRDDGDGVFDAGRDLPYAVAKTSQGGGYNFSIGLGTYFVAVDSATVNTTRGLNPGHAQDEIWAEQTYSTEWNGSAHVGMASFGGLNASVSDAFGLIFFDDFESFAGWQNYSLGVVEQSSEVSYKGRYSLKKTANNDPNGGYKLIGSSVGRDVVLEGYTYRPGPWSGGSIDRIGIEDSGFNGYSFRVSHGGNYISIDRRTSGVATEISTRLTWDPPENEWYYWRLFLFANGTITFATYYENGTLAASVSASDSTYSSFDRVVVHGDYDYYVDNLYLRRLSASYEHIAKLNASAYANESLDFGFSFDVVVNARDGDDVASSARSVQGSLRQFILNANAISGVQESVFRIPINDPGYIVEYVNSTPIDVWRISLAGALPQIVDDVVLNASTQKGNTTIIGGKVVGVDRYKIPDFTTPRVEVNGSSDIFVVNSSRAKITGFSLYTPAYARSVVKIVGNNSFAKIWDSFLGVLANGSKIVEGYYGISVGNYYDSGLHDVNLSASILHNIIAHFQAYAVVVNNGNLANATVEECWIHSNGGASAVSDGISLHTDGNKIIHNYIENNRNNGSIARIDGGAGVEVVVWTNPSYVNNEILNNTISENSRWGVALLGPYTRAVVRYNVIKGNDIGVVVSDQTIATIGGNSIFNNTRTGIDLDITLNPDSDGVTLNDGTLNASQPNYGIDYPVITKAYLNGSELYIEGFVGNESVGGSASFASAEVEVYLVRNSTSGDDLQGNNYSAFGALPDQYGEGWLYLGSLTSDAMGRFNGSLSVAGRGVEELSYITATSTLPSYGTSEFGRNYRIGLYHRNVSAFITLNGTTARINVTALGKTQHGVYVYWLVPANITIAGMSGDYDSYAVNGDVRRWGFDIIRAGETKQVLLNLSTSGSFTLSRAQIIGVDPE